MEPPKSNPTRPEAGTAATIAPAIPGCVDLAPDDPWPIHRMLTVFRPPGAVVELRILGGTGGNARRTAAGYYTDFAKAEADALRLELTAPAGIYFVLNAVDPALLARCPNAIANRAEHLTADRNIIRRRWLLIDADPERPAGISSSDDEVHAAEKIAADVRDWLMEKHGWTEPVEAMSGNGWHLLFPIDLPNDEPSKQIVEKILKAVAAEADRMQPAGPKVKIDTAVGNAARITKLYGTVARKGCDIPDRPHRRSRIVYVPDYLVPERGELT